VRRQASTLIGATAIGLAVTVAVLSNTWFLLLMAVCGFLFVVLAIAHPRVALLLWLLLAPVANAYATVNLPGGVPDIMFGRVAVAVVTVALLLRVMLKGRPLVAFGAVELAMVVLLGVMMLDLVRSGNPTSDFMQDFDERVTPILVFLAARNLCGRRADLTSAAYILAVVGCYLALHGGYQYLTHGQPDPTASAESLDVYEGGQRVNESHLGEGRAVGPFVSAVEYGSVTAIALLGMLFLALYEARGVLRLFAVAAVPVLGAAVIMSSTRSAWLGGFLAVLLMIGLDRRRTILLSLAAGVALVGLVASMVLLPDSSALQARAVSFEPLRARLIMYEMGMRIAVRHPFLGYGRGAPSRIAARKELYARGSADADFAAGQFHNIFLTTLVEWGLVALIAYTAIIGLIVRAAMQLRRRLAREPTLAYHFASLVLGAAVVYVTQGLLVDTPPFLYLNGVFFFLAGLLFAQLDATAPERTVAPELAYDVGVTLAPTDGSLGA
jgi:O-antigen ligase